MRTTLMLLSGLLLAGCVETKTVGDSGGGIVSDTDTDADTDTDGADDTGSTAGTDTDGTDTDGGDTDTDGGDTDTDGGDTDADTDTDGGDTDTDTDTDGGDADTDADTDTDGGSSGPVSLREGKWTYGTVDVDATSCEPVVALLPTAAGSDFFVTASSKKGFDKRIRDLGVDLPCTWGSDGFSCGPISGDAAIEEFDIVLPTTIEGSGTASDSTHAAGDYAVEMDCVGANCDLASATYGITFPCTFDLSWAAAHESE